MVLCSCWAVLAGGQSCYLSGNSVCFFSSASNHCSWQLYAYPIQTTLSSLFHIRFWYINFMATTCIHTFIGADFLTYCYCECWERGWLIRGMHFPQLSCNKAMNKSRSSLPTNFGTHLFRTLTAATQVHKTYAVLAASVHYCLSPLLFEPFPILHCKSIVICLRYMFVLVTVSLFHFCLSRLPPLSVAVLQHVL